MRRSIACTTMLLVAVATATAARQTMAPADLDAPMKRNGPAFAAATKAVQSMAYAEARAQVPIMRTALSEAEAFFVTHKKEDGVKFAKDALAQVAVLDNTLGAPTVDPAVAQEAIRAVQASCAACHTAYRVNNRGEWILKPGSI